MNVYHGSLELVEKPEIRIGDRFLDFGYGFYTTLNQEQALVWGRKLRARKNKATSFVSEYSFDYEKAKQELRIVEFADASKEWLQFVCDNRKGRCLQDYDIVIGPVADDSVYEVVRLYELEVYDLDEAIKRLKIEKLFNQVLFHTEKALKYLHFTKVEEDNANE